MRHLENTVTVFTFYLAISKMTLLKKALQKLFFANCSSDCYFLIYPCTKGTKYNTSFILLRLSVITHFWRQRLSKPNVASFPVATLVESFSSFRGTFGTFVICMTYVRRIFLFIPWYFCNLYGLSKSLLSFSWDEKYNHFGKRFVFLLLLFWVFRAFLTYSVQMVKTTKVKYILDFSEYRICCI